MVTRSTKWSLIVGCCGAVLILLGGLLGWVGFPAIVESTVADTVAVKKDTDAWDRFVELPLPMNFRVYIYSVKNPAEVTNGEKPEFDELGPYVYKETRKKEDIKYDEEHDKASYFSRSMFEFDATLSNGTEEDMVTVVNVPLVLFAQITESIGPLSSSISSYNETVEKLFPEQVEHSVFTKVAVGDYLFKGIKMRCDYEETVPNFGIHLMCAAYKMAAPKQVIIGTDPKINLFSFFGYKHNATDGQYEVRLGIDDVEQIGQVISWEGGTSTDKWGGPTCNKIEGTDSTLFRPKLDDIEELTIYNTDICRTVKLTYQKDVEFMGIAGRRYVGSANVLAGVETLKENYCYCPQSVKNLTDRGGCLRDGALDLSSCQGGPVVLTYAHYLHADKSYKDVYPELVSNEEDHQIFLDLEPNTGTPLRGASRIQMNILLKQIQEVEMMKNLRGELLPILWIEEGVELNDELLDMLHTELLDVLNTLDIVRWVIVGVGIALLVGAGGYLGYKKCF